MRSSTLLFLEGRVCVGINHKPCGEVFRVFAFLANRSLSMSLASCRMRRGACWFGQAADSGLDRSPLFGFAQQTMGGARYDTRVVRVSSPAVPRRGDRRPREPW